MEVEKCLMVDISGRPTGGVKKEKNGRTGARRKKNKMTVIGKTEVHIQVSMCTYGYGASLRGL